MAVVTEVADDTARPLSPMFRTAAMVGSVEAVRLHVNRGDDPDARDAVGLTPLMLACSRNKVEVARLLLESGADHRLVTPSSKSAFDFASEAGAFELIELLQPAPLPARQLIDSENSMPAEIAGAQSGGQDYLEPGGWDAEDVPVAPPDDTALRQLLEAAHTAITRHVPRDDSAVWDDMDALLPERASQLLRPEDPESTSRLRALFLRALREGSVPDLLVDDLARSPAGERDPETARALRLAIQDLGAECDERFEFATPWEDFRVHVDPEEQPDEEAAISDAIAFAESLPTAARRDTLPPTAGMSC